MPRLFCDDWNGNNSRAIELYGVKNHVVRIRGSLKSWRNHTNLAYRSFFSSQEYCWYKQLVGHLRTLLRFALIRINRRLFVSTGRVWRLFNLFFLFCHPEIIELIIFLQMNQAYALSIGCINWTNLRKKNIFRFEVAVGRFELKDSPYVKWNNQWYSFYSGNYDSVILYENPFSIQRWDVILQHINSSLS